jgi:hypothetical protein
MARKSKKHEKSQTTSSRANPTRSQRVAPADDFTQQLQDYLAQLADLRQRGASEDSIRDAFLQFLRSVFPRLEEAEPILLEKHIPALRVRGGYADALYGDLIFECKRRLDDASRAQGHEELTRYLGNQQHPERYLGILTDGETLEVYALRNGDLEPVDQLSLSGEAAGQAKLWLDCYLFHENNLVPTANDVALRFGERSPTFWHSLRVLGEIWRQVGDDATAQTKFVEWQSLLSIVYGSAVGDEGLFLRHTYLALFARGLAFAALRRRAPKADEVAGIITGETFETMGFENFVGDDFFTWMSEGNVFERARGLLQSVATRLTAAYDLKAVREDLLKELYQELVDPQTRHDLGEFYTPDWLAELTLRKAGFPPPKTSDASDGSLFDPSCGSGTFLFMAVRLLRESGLRGKRLVDFCVNHLAGIDVHPLAVSIAKTNLLLALGDDLKGHKQAVGLPVFLADSLSPGRPKLKPDPERDVIPILVDAENIAARAEKAKPRSLYSVFEIPVALADQPDLLHRCLDALLDFANSQIAERDATEGFRARLREMGVPDTQWHRWASNLRLMRWLLEPPVTNSVWRFILNNAYQPELLVRRKFAFVVGNPPWLSYRYIQRPDYQKRVRELVFDYGLLERKQAHLFTQMELATLFFVFCADRFLLPSPASGRGAGGEGVIAFVMPRSVLTGAKQHAEFRKKYVAAAKLLIDCERVVPLFKVPACVVLLTKPHADGPQSQASAAIPMLRLQAQLAHRNASLSQAQGIWKRTEEIFSPLTGGEYSPYWSDIVQGASLAPRCAWFVCPPEIARVVDRGRPQLETDRTTERQAKKPWKGIRLSGSVEADFLFATLLSDNMLPFGSRQLSLVVLPVIENRDHTLQMVDLGEAVRHGKPALAAWLRKAEDVWTKHRKSAADLLDWINWQNKLTRQRPARGSKLVYNKSGTHLCGCAFDARDCRRWRIHNLVVQGFIADYGTYSFEGQDTHEVHYLCAIINAPLVDRSIKPYQTKGAFGAQSGGGERDIHRRPFEVLPIPRFDPKDERHRQLAELSQHSHEKVRAAVEDARATATLVSSPPPSAGCAPNCAKSCSPRNWLKSTRWSAAFSGAKTRRHRRRGWRRWFPLAPARP